MKQALNRSIVLLSLLSTLLWSLHGLSMYFVPLFVHDILSSNTSQKLYVQWIYELYPRLQVEKWRFTESFFTAKASQIALRITACLQLMILYFIFSFFTKPLLKKIKHTLFEVSVSRTYVPYITLLLYSNLLLVIYNAMIEFKDLLYFSPFYQAVGIGKILLPAFPSLYALWMIYGLLIASIIAVICFPNKWISSCIAAICFIYYQLILFGFGKYDHGFSTLTYALLIYPIFLWEVEKTNDEKIDAWTISLIQCMICLSYFYCGIEKLFTSGADWIYSDNLKQHLLIHHTTLGLQLASHGILCHWLSFGVILLQCSFILLPFYKKLKYILLPAGILFHTTAWILLDAGGWFNPWWGVYLFFLFPLQLRETR
ncbi:MAG TPA: hypothetical protein VK750_01700 [Cytophagaceae bacterium]|jgi:hypothetical protein|nr:hypothetical protein [Cytophagaceae bacterium]